MGAVALAEAFASYQAFAEGSAEDEDGKPVEKAVAYGDGPYYLVSYVPSYVTTMGGLKTDSDCRVIDDAGNAIEGLWAIGETTHRFMYNRSFVRQCSNLVGLSMGGLTAATQKNCLVVEEGSNGWRRWLYTSCVFE